MGKAFSNMDSDQKQIVLSSVVKHRVKVSENECDYRYFTELKANLENVI